MIKVTVIIAVYNQGDYIAEAIRSILGQTMPDLELIVVDDGSTDNTREVVQQFQDSRLYYRCQDNRERSAARNAGIRAATGEYVCFLDADGYYLPNKLGLQVAVLDQRQEFGVVYSDVCLCDATGKCLGVEVRGDSVAQPSGDILADLVRKNWITLSAPLIRRSCLHERTFFDESLSCFEDWDVWLRLASDVCFLYQPGTVACYRVHSDMTSNNRERMWRGALTVRRKLEALPQFQALQGSVRQYARFQRGLLESLVGDPRAGHRALADAFCGKPRIAAAGVVWALSLLGQPALRAIWGVRATRRDWLRAARGGIHARRN